MSMSMSESAIWMIGLMTFLILAIGVVLVTFRVYAGGQVRDDHPHETMRDRREARRELAAAPSPAALASGERPRDAVEDV